MPPVQAMCHPLSRLEVLPLSPAVPLLNIGCSCLKSKPEATQMPSTGRLDKYVVEKTH